MHNNNKDNMHNLNPWTDAMETNMQLNISVIIVVYELCSNIYSTPCLEKKKSLQYFRHIFDELKPIFKIFGMSRPEYSLD